MTGMTNELKQVSIIIPTHNRSGSVKKLLDKLAMQQYPTEFMEVIVVANGCVDDTVSVLKEYKAPFTLLHAETNGPGPAVPRNKGASIANGEILIFLDDDIEPTEKLVSAHVAAHENEKTVVIGYLPLWMPERPDPFRRLLKMWWEDKFYEMSRPGHRFRYDDLLSGNFSLSRKLFQEVNGFATDLTCRDDYELGLRLLHADAEFCFSREAKGVHHDEVTDLDRSLKRKRSEAKMDVSLWKLYPGIINAEQSVFRSTKDPFIHTLFGQLVFSAPWLAEKYAIFLRRLLAGLEKRGSTWRWPRISSRLHAYWYHRQLKDELGSRDNVLKYLMRNEEKEIDREKEVTIDLADGIERARERLDMERPYAAGIRFGNLHICNTSASTGFERLKGKHLGKILAEVNSKVLLNGAALNRLLSNINDQHR